MSPAVRLLKTVRLLETLEYGLIIIKFFSYNRNLLIAKANMSCSSALVVNIVVSYKVFFNHNLNHFVDKQANSAPKYSYRHKGM